MPRPHVHIRVYIDNRGLLVAEGKVDGVMYLKSTDNMEASSDIIDMLKNTASFVHAYGHKAFQRMVDQKISKADREQFEKVSQQAVRDSIKFTIKRDRI